MYIYQVNPDGFTVAIKAYDPRGEVPEGWALVPPDLENKIIWADGEYLTEEKPQALIDQENAEKTEIGALRQEMEDLVTSLSYAEIDTHIDNVFGALSDPQKNSLKKLYKVVLFLAKKEVT